MVREPAGVQLSLATVPVATSGTAAWQLASAEAVPPAGTEVIVGTVVSAVIASESPTEALSEPFTVFVARIVNEGLPPGVVQAVEIVSVEVFDISPVPNATGFGLNDAVAPAGRAVVTATPTSKGPVPPVRLSRLNQ